MNAAAARVPSFEPDLAVLDRLQAWEHRALRLIAWIAGITLLLWVTEAIRPWLPEVLRWMKPGSAAGMLLLVYALRRSALQATPADRRRAAVAVLAIAAIAGFTLYEYLRVRDLSAVLPGHMTWQTAIGLLLAGGCVILPRGVGGWRAVAADVLVIVLLGFVLTSLSGFVFDFADLIEGTDARRASPQTLVCFLCAGFVIAARRAHYGFNAVLVGVGIGSRIARTVLPYALALPFVLVMLRATAANQGLVSAAYATAISVSLQALGFLGVVIWMATRINHLESELRHMSLVDELTQVNNRRGFMLLADQALRVARRERLPVTLFFFDLDGLKKVNDTLGHDAGSDFIRAVARLLKTAFREGDVVGRIGGDEFVVLAIDHDRPGDETLRRIEAAAADKTATEALPYALSFSAGFAEVEPHGAHPLEAALQLADQRMYAVKAARKARRDA